MTVLLIIIAIIVLVGLFGVTIFNRLVWLRALVKEAFSGITVPLHPRADLLSNLVETVKGYAAHAKSTFEAITAARGAIVRGRRGVSQAQSKRELIAIAERDQQDRHRVSVGAGILQRHRARSHTRVHSFPDMFFAGPLGIGQEEYYQDSDPAIQTAPKIDFACGGVCSDFPGVGRAIPVVFGIVGPVDRYWRVCWNGRRFAVERGVVGLDCARIVERIGRRRFLGRWWRWRRLVVTPARPGV